MVNTTAALPVPGFSAIIREDDGSPTVGCSPGRVRTIRSEGRRKGGCVKSALVLMFDPARPRAAKTAKDVGRLMSKRSHLSASLVNKLQRLALEVPRAVGAIEALADRWLEKYGESDRDDKGGA